MKKRIVFVLTLVLVSMLVFAACGSSGTGDAPAANDTESSAPADTSTPADSSGAALRIGMINAFSTAPYCAPLNAAAQIRADELGVDLQLVDGKADNQVMLDQAKSFIEQKVDGIILFPADMVGSVAIVKAISESGIPLVICNSRVDASVEDLAVTLICADLVNEGRVIGAMMAEMFPEGGKCAIIEGFPGTDAQIARTTGFEEGIAGSSIEIVQQMTGDWDRAKAMSVADDFITSIPDLAFIYAQDDTMALGAVEAVKAAGKLDQIKVFGIGYMGDEVKESIKAGELYGTVTQSPSFEGANSIQAMVDAINGKELPAWIMTENIPVTPENVDQVDHGYNF